VGQLFVSLSTALLNLRSNKMRTALTMLGIIIGVSTVIVMVAIVEGARYSIVREFDRMGSNLIIIAFQPDRQEQRGQIRTFENLTMDDVRLIEAQCTLLGAVSPELPMGARTLAKHRDLELDVSPRGVQPDYLPMRNFRIQHGRGIEDSDVTGWSKVCVIGDTVRKKLYPNEDPLGQPLELGGVTLTVVGVLEAKGRSSLSDVQEDQILLLPVTTVLKRFVGNEVVGIVLAQPRPGAALTAAMDQVWECLMRKHGNPAGLRVDSQENLLASIGRILTVFGLVMGSIAGMALLVGGIGIMNIMLVSVTERTREIGIRKACGAKRKDILWQFLIEAATVSGMGGIAGIAVGAGMAWAVSVISAQVMPAGEAGRQGLTVHLPLWSILGAFGFSASIGMFFGIYPAMRAAALDPIAALRHE
jgi:putative ABC transport system permease protein